MVNNADIPTTAGFAAATQYVRPEDVAESIPCGPDLDGIVEAVRAYWEAGFTDIALVQIGDENQDLFLKEAAGPLLDKLRDLQAKFVLDLPRDRLAIEYYRGQITLLLAASATVIVSYETNNGTRW